MTMQRRIMQGRSACAVFYMHQLAFPVKHRFYLLQVALFDCLYKLLEIIHIVKISHY